MDVATRFFVRERAGYRCEYCHLPENAAPLAAFHIEHIVARQHGGTDEPANLALACFHCNLRKGPNVAGRDPRTGGLVALYHPRVQLWEDHFTRRGPWIVARTPTGRATVLVLAMNADDLLRLRDAAGC